MNCVRGQYKKYGKNEKIIKERMPIAERIMKKTFSFFEYIIEILSLVARFKYNISMSRSEGLQNQSENKAKFWNPFSWIPFNSKRWSKGEALKLALSGLGLSLILAA